MTTKRKTIGRTLSGTTFDNEPSQPADATRTFTLASGQSATFTLKTIMADRLKDKTFVDLTTNGRDQDALTEASVADITRTLTLQQFFPAIGREVGDKIEILDGSRRRAAALFVGTGLEVLVTQDALSSDDARQLAADIQTAREHNLREIGIRLLVLRDGGMSQKEIAICQNLSAAKVTRAIQAASVPAEMLQVFPDHAELAYPDYKKLLEIATAVAGKGLDLADVIAQVMVDHDELASDLAPDEVKMALMKAYSRAADQQLAKPTPKKAKVEPLWQFDDAKVFARKRSKDRNFSYEFSRLPRALQKELDQVIGKTLAKHLAE
ncbi:ParB family protein [Vibrio diabolicus]|uniref:ParB family protein n=1 Tax=Vibrio diabolicus TaxID=50719 RepID=UPI0024941E24|nr:ParB family protein [Vibrio diabolicus]